VTQEKRRIVQFGQSKLEGLLSSHLRWRKGKQGVREKERERERERGECECHMNGFPRVGILAWVTVRQRMPQTVSQTSLG
jgi:hypothetical protein